MKKGNVPFAARWWFLVHLWLRAKYHPIWQGCLYQKAYCSKWLKHYCIILFDNGKSAHKSAGKSRQIVAVLWVCPQDQMRESAHQTHLVGVYSQDQHSVGVYSPLHPCEEHGSPVLTELWPVFRYGAPTSAARPLTTALISTCAAPRMHQSLRFIVINVRLKHATSESL